MSERITADHEKSRREALYGKSAKLKQLGYVSAVCLMIWIATETRLRSEAKPVQHVVIDGVLVEVVADVPRGLEFLSSMCRLCFFASVAGIALLRVDAPFALKLLGLVAAVDGDTRPSQRHNSREDRSGTTTASDVTPVSSSSSLRPAARPMAMPSVGSAPYSGGNGGSWWFSGPPHTNPATTEHTIHQRLLAPGGMSWDTMVQPQAQSAQELDQLLRRWPTHPTGAGGAQGGYDGSAAFPATAYNGNHSGGLQAFAGDGFVTHGATTSSGIALAYDDLTTGRSGLQNHHDQQATSASSELVSLGVMNSERSVLRLKQWISTVCKGIVDDMDPCNAWFSDQRIKNFDCNHPLSELFDLPATSAPSTTGFGATPSTTGFGATPAAGGFGAAPATGFRAGGTGFGATPAGGGGFGAAAAAAAPKVKKSEALVNERRKLQMQMSSNATTAFDYMAKIDLRLSLEAVLDVSRSFPTDSHPTEAVPPALAARRRRAIIQRIRTFAAQRTMQSFHSGPDTPDTPADPYIIVHLLRTRVPALTHYILLPYEQLTSAGAAVPGTSGAAGHSTAGSRDLAVYVGSCGDPYFYVRHRGHGAAGHEKLMRTSEGHDSIFEALLLFFAVVRRFYGGSYGNVEGMVDLKQLNLDHIF